jgi:hypothetical protein
MDFQMDFDGKVTLAILLALFMLLQQSFTVPSIVPVIFVVLVLVNRGQLHYLRDKLTKLTTPELTACTRCLSFDAYKVRSENEIAKHVEEENKLEARIWNKDIDYETISCELIKSENEANGLKTVIADLKERNNRQCNCPLIPTSPRVDIINKLERKVKELEATIKTLEPFKDKFETTQAKFDADTQAWGLEVDSLKNAISDRKMLTLDPITNDIIIGNRPEPAAEASAQPAPAQQDPAAQAPAAQAPAQQGPVQQTTAQQAPVTQAPVQQAQVDDMDGDTLDPCTEPEEDDVEMEGEEPFNTSGFGSNTHTGFPAPAPIVSWPGTGFGPINASNQMKALTSLNSSGSTNGFGSNNNGFGSANNFKWSNGFGNTNNSGSSKDNSSTNMGSVKFAPPADSFGSYNSWSSSNSPGSSTGNGFGDFGSSSTFLNGFAPTSTFGFGNSGAPTAPASLTGFEALNNIRAASSGCANFASSFGRPSSSTSNSSFGTPCSSTFGNSSFGAFSTPASSTFGSTTPSLASSAPNFSTTTIANYGSKPSTPTISSIFASSSKGQARVSTDIAVTCTSSFGHKPLTITVPCTDNLTKVTDLFKTQAKLASYQCLTLEWNTGLQWQQLKDTDTAIGMHPEIVGVDKMHTLSVSFESKR